MRAENYQWIPCFHFVHWNRHVQSTQNCWQPSFLLADQKNARLVLSLRVFSPKKTWRKFEFLPDSIWKQWIQEKIAAFGAIPFNCSVVTELPCIFGSLLLYNASVWWSDGISTGRELFFGLLKLMILRGAASACCQDCFHSQSLLV